MNKSPGMNGECYVAISKDDGRIIASAAADEIARQMWGCDATRWTIYKAVRWDGDMTGLCGRLEAR